MAKNKLDLSATNLEPVKKTENSSDNAKKGVATKKNNAQKRKSVGRYFKDIVSELKKVDWAKFKSTKGNKGILAQTGTVLFIVLVFIVIITAMDLGLSELLRLLIGVASK